MTGYSFSDDVELCLLKILAVIERLVQKFMEKSCFLGLQPDISVGNIEPFIRSAALELKACGVLRCLLCVLQVRNVYTGMSHRLATSEQLLYKLQNHKLSLMSYQPITSHVR